MSANMEAVYAEWKTIKPTGEKDEQGNKLFLVGVGTDAEFPATETDVMEHLLSVAQADNKLARMFHVQRYVKMFELGQYPYVKPKEEPDVGTNV